MDVSEAKRLRKLDDENAKLKKLRSSSRALLSSGPHDAPPRSSSQAVHR